MLVRDHIADRARIAASGAGVDVDLPRTLKRDGGQVRTGLLRRLSASRRFALGSRAGALAGARPGGGFRVDLRQRVIVKALVSRHMGRGAARGATLARHVSYLGRNGTGREGERPEFFTPERGEVAAAAEVRSWSSDRHHFRFIISPEHGDKIADLPRYVRDVMGRVAQDLSEPDLNWVGVCHYDTDQPHAHVLIRGRRADGRDLVIPRAYVAYGFRSRAQEAAQERLGNVQRIDAERRVWRETQADRYTGLDRRMLNAADPAGRIADGSGRRDAWGALMRGRLLHLERLGLANWDGGHYRLAPDLELRLRTLQISKDIIRTLNQRRMEGAKEVKVAGLEAVRGRVVRAGAHDELGASPYVVVRDAAGVEHYGRLAPGAPLPQRGAEFTLSVSDRHMALAASRAGLGLDL